jgi:hypothetical protein
MLGREDLLSDSLMADGELRGKGVSGAFFAEIESRFVR